MADNKVESAEVNKAALPNTIINPNHKRGLHSRGGENSLVKAEGQMPEMWNEGGIYYIGGKVVSEKKYRETLAKYKPG
jgi:hypothetical protein